MTTAQAFRVWRIPNPDSLWVVCPYRRCKGLEVPSGATYGEIGETIAAHIAVHERAQSP